MECRSAGLSAVHIWSHLQTAASVNLTAATQPTQHNNGCALTLPGWHLRGRSASLRTLPVNYKCHYCQWSGGRPLFTGAIFAVKLKHCTALAMETWIALTHACIVLLPHCVEGFVPPHSVHKHQEFLVFSLCAVWNFYFSFLPLAIFNTLSRKYGWRCKAAEGCEERAVLMSQVPLRFRLQLHLPSM